MQSFLVLEMRKKSSSKIMSCKGDLQGCFGGPKVKITAYRELTVINYVMKGMRTDFNSVAGGGGRSRGAVTQGLGECGYFRRSL